ncbi:MULTISPECIES: MarR family winged helix-turn-helix transcriptional regulator [Lactobacillus]|uniref:MarR family transcriptional regulator n=1 Tax=Lactobacillus xujianguonis TaxID=2495899 RepID=A0A437STT1_9LACO|nr:MULTISPECIES: MarR family transcriptional regulator [Lactobacillus]RVU70323.1 MarR family transcriptional regulator [Lactobacillus xujianguonis]RVU76866.1 MarR family transcriptional regulator [Lactobacillus xujianguonis]
MNHLYKEINDALYNTYYGINRIEEQELKKSRFKDLTVKEMHAIDAITMYEQLTTSEVAKKLHLSRATVTSTVDRLVKKGYAERVRDETDRRIVRLKLTKKGRVLCRAYRAYHNMMVRSFLQNLDQDELETIYHAFKNLEKFVNAH